MLPKYNMYIHIFLFLKQYNSTTNNYFIDFFDCVFAVVGSSFDVLCCNYSHKHLKDIKIRSNFIIDFFMPLFGDQYAA